MEKNMKVVWAVVAVVVIVGLVLIAYKNGQPIAPDTINNEAVNESSQVSTPKSGGSTSTTFPPAVKTTTKPTDNVVQLTSSGFKPFIMEINRGESVQFVNASNDAMIIHSQTENPQNAYPGFSQEGGPLGRGGKFYFAFTLPGAWPYYNLNTITGAKDQGVIIVK
ncbi:MAG: hypothetical protein Q7S86_01380 [bacterium]|nr:hypothetical protein [bacterium]